MFLYSPIKPEWCFQLGGFLSGFGCFQVHGFILLYIGDGILPSYITGIIS